MNQEAVRPGQLYRSTEGGLFGGPGPNWEVVSVAERYDGSNYATLAMTRDPSERKTLAMEVLLDRRMYRLVPDVPADDPILSEC